MGFFRAARSLARTPTVTFACIFTLALGIAASTAMFTLIHSLLLRPLAYPDPATLAAIEPGASWGDVLAWERQSKTVTIPAVYMKTHLGIHRWFASPRRSGAKRHGDSWIL